MVWFALYLLVSPGSATDKTMAWLGELELTASQPVRAKRVQLLTERPLVPVTYHATAKSYSSGAVAWLR